MFLARLVREGRGGRRRVTGDGKAIVLALRAL